MIELARPVRADEIAFASNPPDDTRWRILTDLELLALPDPDYAIDDLIQRLAVVVFYSLPSVGKTTLAAAIAVAKALRRNLFGHRIREPGQSLMVCGEDPCGWKRRVVAAKVSAGIPASSPIGVFTMTEGFDLLDESQVARFIQMVRESQQAFEFVFLDTFASMTAGAAENSSEDMTRAMQHCHRIKAELNCTVILLHHSNATGARERGHSAMRGAADAMISMAVVDDEILLESSKSRNGPPFETLRLRLVELENGQGMVLKHAGDVVASAQPSPLQAKLLAILTEGSETGLTTAEWRRAANDVVSERSFYRAIAELERKALILRTGQHFRPTGTGHAD